MSAVTPFIEEIDPDDESSSQQLLAVLYHELRQLAASRLAQEKPGQTLQATALVHEAWLRLTANGNEQKWDSRGHFFAAAAEAMRRILVDQARRKDADKRSGNCIAFPIEQFAGRSEWDLNEYLDFNEALEKLILVDSECAELVKLRLFAGLTTEEAGELLGIPNRTAYRCWDFAKAWLHRELTP